MAVAGDAEPGPGADGGPAAESDEVARIAPPVAAAAPVGPASTHGIAGGRVRLGVATWFADVLVRFGYDLPEHEHPWDGEWIDDANASTVTVGSFLREASLVPASYDIVNTLWSLRWELIFTALLPVMIAVAVLLRRSTAALVAPQAAITAATMTSRPRATSIGVEAFNESISTAPTRLTIQAAAISGDSAAVTGTPASSAARTRR